MNNETFWESLNEKIYLVSEDSNKNFFYTDLTGKPVNEDDRILLFESFKDISYFQMKLFDNNDDSIAIKRMGFTPKNKSDNGDIGFINVGTLKDKILHNIIDDDIELYTDEESLGAVSGNKSRFIDKGDVLVSFKQSIGFVNIFNSDINCISNEAIDIIKINEKYNKKYICYQLSELYKKNSKQNTGSKTLNDDIKKTLKIKIPCEINLFSTIITSLQIQQSIAFYIENSQNILNEKIEILDNIKFLLDFAKTKNVGDIFS